MAWRLNNGIFVGSHLWFAPVGAAFTVPGAGVISQAGTWPGVTDPNWANWALGICESCEIDPKNATGEVILAPTPGAVQALDVIKPYAIPEVMFTTLGTDVLAPQLALNSQQLWAAATTQFNPNGGGGPGMRGILKAQQYDSFNNLILNWQSWVFLELKSALKMAPKSMTKPEYTATLLYSVNNTGAV